jgi:hypothetical protein
MLKQQWTIEEIYITKHGRDGPWVGPFQNCVRQPRPPLKMAAVTKIEISSIGIIDINRLKEKFHRKTQNIC